MSNNNISYLILIIVILALVVGGVYWYLQNQSTYTSTLDSNPQNNYNPPTNSNQQNNNQPNPVSNSNPTTASITIQNFAFSPNNITVHKGTMVTWKNNDSTAHTVTGDNGGPASQYLNPGDSYSYTFSTVGTFPYHCSIHPSMTAVVQVIN